MNQTKVVWYLITLSLRRVWTVFTVLLMGVNTGCAWPCKVTVLRPFRHFKLESRDAQPAFVTVPGFICLQILSGRDPGINKWGFRPTVLYWIHIKILNGPKPASCGTSSVAQWSQSTGPHPQDSRLTVVTGAARPRNRGSILCKFNRFTSSPKGSGANFTSLRNKPGISTVCQISHLLWKFRVHGVITRNAPRTRQFSPHTHKFGSWVSSISVMTKLRTVWQLRNRCWLPENASGLSLLQSVQTDTAARTNPYSWKPRVPSPRVKRPWRKAIHFYPLKIFKDKQNYTSTPPTPSRRSPRQLWRLPSIFTTLNLIFPPPQPPPFLLILLPVTV